MYLNQVLADIKKESAAPKVLHAEHLFKLNEAVFNLPEEDTVDSKMALRLFQAVEKIRQAYNTGKYDNADSNFFYDYLALLGTMQNQHFFTQKQTEKMLGWIKELVDDGSTGAASEGKGGGNNKALEAENERLRKKLAQYEELQGAVAVIRSFDVAQAAKGKAKAKAKSEGKGKGKAPVYEEEEPEPPVRPTKGKGKGKGKGKAVIDDYEEEVPPPSKGKGKGKSGKGGKGAPAIEDEPLPPKGKGKGKGKGKDSGKDGKGAVEEPPPLRATKGKGKVVKGKGKGALPGKGGKGASWKAKNA